MKEINKRIGEIKRRPWWDVLGFESEQELHRMVSEVDLSTQKKMLRFKGWQRNDGTKQGLLLLETELEPQ